MTQQLRDLTCCQTRWRRTLQSAFQQRSSTRDARQYVGQRRNAAQARHERSTFEQRTRWHAESIRHEVNFSSATTVPTQPDRCVEETRLAAAMSRAHQSMDGSETHAVESTHPTDRRTSAIRSDHSTQRGDWSQRVAACTCTDTSVAVQAEQAADGCSRGRRSDPTNPSGTRTTRHCSSRTRFR